MIFFCVLRCRQLLLLEEQRCTATGSCSHGKNIFFFFLKKSRCKFQGFCCCCCFRGGIEIMVCVLEGRCRWVGGCRNLCVMEGRCRLFGQSRNPCVRDVICKIIWTLKSHARSEKRERERRSLTVEPCLYGPCLFRSRGFALRCYAFGGGAPRAV